MAGSHLGCDGARPPPQDRSRISPPLQPRGRLRCTPTRCSRREVDLECLELSQTASHFSRSKENTYWRREFLGLRVRPRTAGIYNLVPGTLPQSRYSAFSAVKVISTA